MNDTVLIELRSEELPPKSLRQLSEAFADSVFCGPESAAVHRRRQRMHALCHAAPTGPVDHRRRRPTNPTASSNAKAPRWAARSTRPASRHQHSPASCVRPASASSNCTRRLTAKSEYFVARIEKKGETLAAYLAEIVAQALKKLPIPKVMRWGDSEHQFVRPVHSLILLHGEHVVAGEVLGLRSDRLTLGHRFLSTGEIRIGSTAEYVDKLAAGKVIASFAERRAAVAAQLDAAAPNASMRASTRPTACLTR
jgi:glycyl-tRNA synthetase beta chain